MTGWNLPPGTTDYHIDASIWDAHDPELERFYEELDAEDRQICLLLEWENMYYGIEGVQ